MADIKYREFVLIQNLKTSGLMTIDANIINKVITSYGYDYSKFYYEIMKKLRLPTSEPIFYLIDEVNYEKLDFGIYRIKIICNNPIFMNVFNFNVDNHYTHNTIKICYKHREKYGITFQLLEADENYNYNFVHYAETCELKKILKGYFKIMDELIKKCNKNNFLLKSYLSLSWGILSKFNKKYITESESQNYDMDHLTEINYTDKYDYYIYKYNNDMMTLIPSKKSFKNAGIARIKMFLPEYCRNFIFDMISTNNLEQNVLRIQTDGICFNKQIDFEKMKLKYYPIVDNKTTNENIKFYNVNSYFHICNKCGCEYKYNKNENHEC
jgi:hypothetical protein